MILSLLFTGWKRKATIQLENYPPSTFYFCRFYLNVYVKPPLDIIHKFNVPEENQTRIVFFNNKLYRCGDFYFPENDVSFKNYYEDEQARSNFDLFHENPDKTCDIPVLSNWIDVTIDDQTIRFQYPYKTIRIFNRTYQVNCIDYNFSSMIWRGNAVRELMSSDNYYLLACYDHNNKKHTIIRIDLLPGVYMKPFW